MISVTPASRFHRIVKKLRRVESISAPRPYASLIKDSETVLGVYRGDNDGEEIVFADGACLFQDPLVGEIRRVDYVQIIKVGFPLPASESIDLTLSLVDSSIATIRVVGREDSFRDVFEVGRFFMRVVEDSTRLTQSHTPTSA
ncbi:MAG: hypothetical protein ABIU95_10520 [Burkholderiales bacterium]